MIHYGRHDIDDADIAAVADVLRGDWLTTGPAVTALEAGIEEVTRTPAMVLTSGTAALHAAYAAMRLEPDDEVITPPITFVATQATAALLGARIVFADVRPDTATIDPKAVEAAITERTRVISAVDYAGHPADMDELRVIADRHGLFLLEDAAHSLGSTYRGRPVGTLADVTTLSFYPTKNITTGEGGAVCASDPELLERARLFSRQGLIRSGARLRMPDEGPWHQEVHDFSLNYRLSDVLAALGLSQLRRLPEFKQRRAEIKATYDAAFAGVDGLTLPHRDPDVDPVWHLYPLRVPAEVRKAVFVDLREAGIGVQVNYIPAYWHPAFDPAEYPRGLCPNGEAYYRSEISLPMHVGLTPDDLGLVVETVLSSVRRHLG